MFDNFVAEAHTEIFYASFRTRELIPRKGNDPRITPGAFAGGERRGSTSPEWDSFLEPSLSI